MPHLWKTIGYDKVAADIAEALSASSDVLVLEGPPGVGKTWLAKGIGALWKGSGGSTIVAAGDSARSDVPLDPFRFSMHGLPRRWTTVGSSIAAIARAGEALAGTAGLFTATVEGLVRMRRARRRAEAPFLGEMEQEVLSELESLGERPILLIADNFHWWDPKSLQFLAALREQRVMESFPFLTEMRVLAVQTTEPYQTVAHPDAHERFVSPSTTTYFRLNRIPREGFDDVLVALGAEPEAAKRFAGEVFALSGGHLLLAKRCAAHLIAGDVDDFLSATDEDEFLQKLLPDRMRSLGALGRQALSLLQIAALLGLTFRRDELVCASGSDAGQMSRLLRYCRDEDVVILTDDTGSFVHDLFRQYFLRTGVPDMTGVYERLADCLRMLRPSEYTLRCLNALRAERQREAAALAVHAALQLAREGKSWRTLPEKVAEILDVSDMVRVVESLVTALDDLRRYRFAECLSTLDRLPRDLPKSVLAETDYLRAMCMMSTRSEDDRAAGRAILEAWTGYERDEPEIGIRILQLLLYALTFLLEKKPGQNLEGLIQQILMDRVSFDPGAKDALYTLDRCSGSLYQPDLALARTKRAVEHFGPQDNQTVLRRPVEYYRCLLNLSAHLIGNARYREAVDVSARIEVLVGEHAPGTFPRLDFPRMNRLLAEYRLGAVSVAQAVESQRELAQTLRIDADPFYLDNALAVYLALNECLCEAAEILDRLNALLLTRSNPEANMVYTINSNRAVVAFLAGERDTAREEWRTLSELVRRIVYVIRPVLIRRHELLGSVLFSARRMSSQQFDRCLLTAAPPQFGPLWDNLGRGFRLPEIEIWREN